MSAASALTRVGREGLLELAFERRGERTVMTERRFTLPLQFLEPMAFGDSGAVCATLLNPTGGVCGGDRLQTRLRLGGCAHVCVTTPSATRVYRCDAAPARIETRIEVERGATLEYVPDHLIPHPGAALEQALAVDVAEGGRALVWDAFALGRVARGERWEFARISSELRLRASGRLVFLERIQLGPRLAGLDPTAGLSYVGTLVCLAPGDVAWKQLAAELETRPVPVGTRIGASPLARGGMALRVLAPAAFSLAEVFADRWSVLRRDILGLGPADLRKN